MILAFSVCLMFGSATTAQDSMALESLHSKAIDTRRSAANQLRSATREVQRQSLPSLIELLIQEKDGQVRLAVLDTVTALGPDAEPAIPALIQTLKSSYGGQGQEESHQDYRSALALATIGKPAVEGLRGLLKERQENVRAEVAMALGRIGPDAWTAVPDLIVFFNDPSLRIRREAAQALGLIGSAAIAGLIDSSKSETVNVRIGAVEALGFLLKTEDRATQALIDRTRDPVAEVRSAAVLSLARLKIAEDTLSPVALEALRDDDERVRLAVVSLLDPRPGLRSKLAPDLASLLTTGSDGTARLAAFLLGKSGVAELPRLLEALREHESRIDSISEGLATIGRPALSQLSKAIDDPDPRVRQGSALAIGQIRPLPSGIAEKLALGLSDPEINVRSAFLAAVGHLGRRGSISVPAVRRLLVDSSPEIRARAIEVLCDSSPRDETLLEDLTPLVDDPSTKVQARAIDALRVLGPLARKALPGAIRRLASPDAEVRLAAVQMVESHGFEASEAIPSLISLLNDPQPKIRTIAATTLGRFGKLAQAAFPALASLVGDKDVSIREAAISTLASLELEVATIRPHLARALQDDSPEVRRAASRAIPRLGPEGVLLIPDIILMAARRENARSVERLLRPFEKTGPDARSIPDLVKCLEHDQAAVKLLAIKYLALAGEKARDALPALEKKSEDPSDEVRRRAKLAVMKIQG